MAEVTNNLAKSIGDREFQKFTTDANGECAVRIAPGAVTDTDGNELEIDTQGRATTYDNSVLRELQSISGLLKDVLFELKVITGEQ